MDIKDLEGGPIAGWPEEEKEKTPLGTGEGEVPLARPQDLNVDMRTMASDLQSIAESGGGAPRSYTPAPVVPSRPTTPLAPEKNESPFIPPQVASTETPNAAPAAFETAPKKSHTGLFVSLSLVILLVLAGAAAYFFYPPIQEFLGTGGEGEKTAGLTDNNLPPLVPPLVETVPSGETATSSETGGEEVLPAAPLTHVSLFKQTAASLQEAVFDPLALEVLQKSFGTAAPETPSLAEHIFKDAQGAYLPFASVFETFFPGVLSPSVLSEFESDHTIFAYMDKNGTWPGFVVRVKSGTNSAELITSFGEQFEKAGVALTNLYVQSPGEAQTWSTGRTGTIQNRYLIFRGAELAVSLNYAFVNDLLVVSASYDGFKAALNRL